MINLGIFNLTSEVNGYKVKNKELKYSPDDKTNIVRIDGKITMIDEYVKVNKQKTAKRLAKEYPHYKVQIEDIDGKVSDLEQELKDMHVRGLHIIVSKTGKVLSYVFIERYINEVQQYKNFLGHKDVYGEKTNKLGMDTTLIGDMSSKAKINGIKNSIVAGHKASNAPKSVKLAQALGNTRTQAFRLHAIQF
ncbi:MAG: hypothetical protein ACRDDH_07900 [Cetobacterium sp.]|uniref:hypothetical protein n=1 Tax=Cetobacterium sp. TaxID=2071632 RepID=UPI003EE5FFB7